MSKYVAILTHGKITIHFPNPTGNYATLCNMDGDDIQADVDQTSLSVPRGRKVDCTDCIAIFDVCNQFSEKDIQRRRE